MIAPSQVNRLRRAILVLCFALYQWLTPSPRPYRSLLAGRGGNRLPRVVLFLRITLFQWLTPGPRPYRRLIGGGGGT
jgi:hypothetical protein